MNISKNQFEVLVYIEREGGKKITQRAIADDTHLSLGVVNRVLGELNELGLISVNSKKALQITRTGLDSLEPYRVRRAVVIAAGFGPHHPEHPQAVGTGTRENDCRNPAGRDRTGRHSGDCSGAGISLGAV